MIEYRWFNQLGDVATSTYGTDLRTTVIRLRQW